MERIVWFLMLQTLLWNIPSINSQRSIQQYLHLTGLPYIPSPIPATTQNAATNQATINKLPVNNQVATIPQPAKGLPALTALSLPALIAGLSQPMDKPKTEPQLISSNIDSKLLNNLAVALQLLIVSNILNSPPTDSITDKLKDKLPTQTLNPTQTPNPTQFPNPTQNQMIANQYVPQNQYIFQNPLPQKDLMPNANFVGTPNFADPNIMQNLKPTRNSVTLMSPYEALGPLSTFSDPTPQFSTNLRKDFLSPYAMIDRDVFSTNELF